jgi:hypothetical protein
MHRALGLRVRQATRGGSGDTPGAASSPLDGDRLFEMLRRSDLVKFALERPAYPGPALDIDRAVELVKEAHRDRKTAQAEQPGKEAEHGV